MTDVFEVRAEIARHYAGAGFDTHDHVPATSLTVDADGTLLVQPGEEWLTRDDEDVTYDPAEYAVHLALLVLVEFGGDNAAAVDALEHALQRLFAHRPAWLAVERVTAPDLLTNGEWQHYGCRVDVKTIARI